MKRILNVNITDIVPFSKGLIFVRREQMPDGVNKVSFFIKRPPWFEIKELYSIKQPGASRKRMLFRMRFGID